MHIRLIRTRITHSAATATLIGVCAAGALAQGPSVPGRVPMPADGRVGLQPVQKPPTLTESVLYYDAAKWQSYLKGITFVRDTSRKSANWGSIRLLPAGTPTYVGGKPVYHDSVLVAFYPVLGVHLVDVGNDFPAGDPGRMVAQIVNLGVLPVAVWDLQPGTVYYIVIERDASQKDLRMYFVHPPTIQTRVAVRTCHKESTPPTSSQADLGPDSPCDWLTNLTNRQQPGTDAPWFTCAYGCCVGANTLVVEAAGQKGGKKGPIRMKVHHS